MSSSYYLFRLKRSLGRRRTIDESDVLSFGSRKSIVARLAAIPGARKSKRGIFLEVGGVRIEYTMDDPVGSIDVARGGPWDLLPAFEKLRSLGPMALFDEGLGEFRPPEFYAAKAPKQRPPTCGPPQKPGARTPLREQWTADFKGGTFRHLLAHDGRLVVTAWQTIAALDIATGTERWALTLGRREVCTTFVGDVLVCGSWQPDLYGLDPRTGRTLWSTPIAEGMYLNPCAVDRRRVAIATVRGVAVLDVRSGKPIWKQTLKSADPHAGNVTALAADRRYVVAGTNVGACVCFDAVDGTILGSRAGRIQDAMSGSVWGLAVSKDRVFCRRLTSLSRLRLPILEEEACRPCELARGHPHTPVFAGKALLEPASSIGVPPTRLNTTGYDGFRCVVRAWTLDLDVAWESPSPDSTPAALPFGNGTWAVILSAPTDPSGATFRIALVDRRTKSIVAEETRGKDKWASFAIATEGDFLLVGSGGKLLGFKPVLASARPVRRH